MKLKTNLVKFWAISACVLTFGTIPQGVSYPSPFMTPTGIVYNQPVAQASHPRIQEIEDGEESYFQLTPKGVQNQILSSPPTSPKRRRRMNNRATGKRTLEDFSGRMVAVPNVPVANSFSALQTVPRNFSDGYRQARQAPQQVYI